MLTLYHFGDAICAQKVRLALAEKALEWKSIEVTPGEAEGGLRSSDYLRLNPNGVVPTLIHNDRVLTESRIISEYIEDAFDGVRLLPADPAARHSARYWSKQIDDTLHLMIFALSFVATMRDRFLAIPRELLNEKLPGMRDPIKRVVSLDLLENNLDSKYVAAATERFRRMVDDMEVSLNAHAWLAGDEYSLADADYTPYLGRLEDLGHAAMWSDRPAVTRWWDSVRNRPSYANAISAWRQPREAAARPGA